MSLKHILFMNECRAFSSVDR